MKIFHQMNEKKNSIIEKLYSELKNIVILLK